MDREFKDYDGRYYDKEREDHTIFETENTQAEIMLDYINKELKKMGESWFKRGQRKVLTLVLEFNSIS